MERVGNAIKAAVETAEATNWRREIGLASDIGTPWHSGFGHLGLHGVVGAKAFILDIDPVKKFEKQIRSPPVDFGRREPTYGWRLKK